MAFIERLEERRLFAAATISIPIQFSVQNAEVTLTGTGLVQDRPGGGCIMLDIAGQANNHPIQVNIDVEWGTMAQG